MYVKVREVTTQDGLTIELSRTEVEFIAAYSHLHFRPHFTSSCTLQDLAIKVLEACKKACPHLSSKR